MFMCDAVINEIINRIRGKSQFPEQLSGFACET